MEQSATAPSPLGHWWLVQSLLVLARARTRLEEIPKSVRIVARFLIRFDTYVVIFPIRHGFGL